MSTRKGPNGEALPTKAQVTTLEGIRDKGEIVASCPRAYHSAAAILLRRGWAKERTRAVRDGRGPWELTSAGETALRLMRSPIDIDTLQRWVAEGLSDAQIVAAFASQGKHVTKAAVMIARLNTTTAGPSKG